MIFHSPFPPVTIPTEPLTPFVLRAARARGAKPALIDGLSGRTLTYAELAAAVQRVAAALTARGLRRGDVFAIFSPNNIEYALAFHGVVLAGGVVTTINPAATTAELAHQLSDAGARYVLTVPALFAKAQAAAGATAVRELFVVGPALPGAHAFAELLAPAAAPHALATAALDPHTDLAALPYSSGTTGLPKGVMLTHHNMVANLCQIAGTGHLRGDDTLVCVLPMFHIYGLNVIMNAGLHAGATIVILPRYDLPELLRVMQDYRVTFAHVAPPIVLALAKHPCVADYDLSALQTIFSAAAPLSAAIAQVCAARLGCFIKQGYGMTEAAPATHMLPHDPTVVRYDSVGWCVPNMECKLVDTASGAALGVGAAGEICLRGPQVMRGYHNQPEATAQTLDADGWLHTGDIGYADAAGYFYIVDRVKELIKYKGLQVAPAELEAVLLAHPAVADAAVIPSPDEAAGEVPKAFVVLRTAGPPVTATELLAYVAAQVAPYKKVRRVEFIAQIPKSAAGKILRRLLVAREREAGGAQS